VVLGGRDGGAGGDGGTVSSDESVVAGGSGGVGDEIVMDVAAGDGEQTFRRDDDVGGGWHCICTEGGGELGIGDMEVDDVGGGGQGGERTMLLSYSLSVSLRRSSSQRHLNSFSRLLCRERCVSGRRGSCSLGHTRLVGVPGSSWWLMMALVAFQHVVAS
jgi:hypothetical protein